MYLVTYDLKLANPEEYELLRGFLKGLGSPRWAAILESALMIETSLTAQQIHNGIQMVMKQMRPVVANGSRWVVAPIKVADCRGWIATDQIDWWNDAIRNNY